MMQKQISANKRHTIIIMFGFILLISAIGAAFAFWLNSWSILIYFGVIALVYTLFQYFAASSIAVAMTGAKEIKKSDNRRLYNIVENLSITAGLPMPKVCIIEDPAPNAFATGRDPAHSVVAATTGLLDIMNDKELTAVMAHEMSHVKNYDIRVSTIVFGLVCLIGLLSDLGIRMLWIGDDDDRSPVGLIIMILTAIFAPLAASIAQLAISRQREYLADAGAVNLTRFPEGMVDALKKLDTHSRPMRRQNSATEALYINNPLKKGKISKLFSTHPPIEERIKRIEDAKYSF